MKIVYGTTRIVFLTERYAIKIPTWESWSHFLYGLLANMQEVSFSKLSKRLCPITFRVRAGFLLVMERAEPLSMEEFVLIDFDKFIDCGDLVLPVENKLDSFGKIRGQIVAIDYGS